MATISLLSCPFLFRNSELSQRPWSGDALPHFLMASTSTSKSKSSRQTVLLATTMGIACAGRNQAVENALIAVETISYLIEIVVPGEYVVKIEPCPENVGQFHSAGSQGGLHLVEDLRGLRLA